ncbi:GMC oxidoreductase [Nonomuraea sp. NPDC049709]|uniref:GMC oxidoreductase n=1 Tax=Nonomuraea sp. NPDC049709 TaxID=3154736 RepID=UPI0034470C6A
MVTRVNALPHPSSAGRTGTCPTPIRTSARAAYAGHEVRVTTVADPRHARVAFRVESDLLATGQAAVAVRFPYASDGFFDTSGWSAPDRHATTLHPLDEHACRFSRILDDTTYATRLEGEVNAAAEPHTFELATSAGVLELVAAFAPGGVLGRGEFTTIEGAAISWWRQFWTSGAAVDFAGSTDPRAAELERRVVLSQYLTAVNCSGTMPPQETGLITDSWQGKFHLEMHFWHAAHFAAWGRPELLERSLGWYLSILDVARGTARRQHYEGARWPKHVGPDGRESPSDIGSLLIWQQPHLLYLLELLHRCGRTSLVARFAELVEETAAFMASFVEERDGVHHLPAPLVPAQEHPAPLPARQRRPPHRRLPHDRRLGRRGRRLPRLPPRRELDSPARGLPGVAMTAAAGPDGRDPARTPGPADSAASTTWHPGPYAPRTRSAAARPPPSDDQRPSDERHLRCPARPWTSTPTPTRAPGRRSASTPTRPAARPPPCPWRMGAPHRRLSGGQHQAGTARMSDSPRYGATDRHGKLWGTDRVHIADASLHVTNGGANPVLTIMALAWRTATHAAAAG